MVAPGLGITPACERLLDERDQLLATLRPRVEVPRSPIGVFQDDGAAGAEQPYVGPSGRGPWSELAYWRFVPSPAAPARSTSPPRRVATSPTSWWRCSTGGRIGPS
jgi:hypothetical protein